MLLSKGVVRAAVLRWSLFHINFKFWKKKQVHHLCSESQLHTTYVTLSKGGSNVVDINTYFCIRSIVGKTGFNFIVLKHYVPLSTGHNFYYSHEIWTKFQALGKGGNKKNLRRDWNILFSLFFSFSNSSRICPTIHIAMCFYPWRLTSSRYREKDYWLLPRALHSIKTLYLQQQFEVSPQWKLENTGKWQNIDNKLM